MAFSHRRRKLRPHRQLNSQISRHRSLGSRLYRIARWLPSLLPRPATARMLAIPLRSRHRPLSPLSSPALRRRRSHNLLFKPLRPMETVTRSSIHPRTAAPPRLHQHQQQPTVLPQTECQGLGQRAARSSHKSTIKALPSNRCRLLLRSPVRPETVLASTRLTLPRARCRWLRAKGAPFLSRGSWMSRRGMVMRIRAPMGPLESCSATDGIWLDTLSSCEITLKNE